MATVSLTVESGTRSPGISAKQLGLVAMDEPGGMTQATAEANSAILNLYFSTTWRTHGLAIHWAAKGYAFWNTVTISEEGFVWYGAGTCDTRAESVAGAATRIVCINPNLDRLFYYNAAYLQIYGCHFQGWFHATNTNTLKAETSNFCGVCFEQGVQHDGIGTGKIVATAISFSCFGTAMVFGQDQSGDNADQYNIASLRTFDCGIGMHLICPQSVGNLVGQYEGTRTGTMCYAERGGKLLGLQWTAENDTPTILRVRAQTFDNNSFHFINLYVDGTVGSTQCTVFQVDAPLGGENTPSPYLLIDNFHVGTQVTLPPKFYTRGYARVHIKGGEQLFAGMIEHDGGSSLFMGDFLCCDARYRSGQDPTGLVTLTGTTGYAKVVLRNNGNVGNVPFNDEYKFLSRVASVTTPTNYDPMTV